MIHQVVINTEQPQDKKIDAQNTTVIRRITRRHPTEEQSLKDNPLPAQEDIMRQPLRQDNKH